MAGGTSSVPSSDSSANLGRRKRFRVKEKRFQASAEKCALTEPTSLSRWGKLGRGGAEDETVKPLDGIQRVQIPHGQSEQAGR
jgi:hypothetical protein